MFTTRFTQVAVAALATGFCLAPQAELIVGCNAASQTNVDCSAIFGGTITDQGYNFFTDTDYHVGYRNGVSDSPDFLGNATQVTQLDSFVTTLDKLPGNSPQIAGNTMVIEFDAEQALSGMVLSGLSSSVPRDPLMNGIDVEFETARVLAFDERGNSVFDELIYGENGYVYVDFGDIVPMINTLLISSGGGLPGLASTNNNVAYFITPLPEPGPVLLFVAGLLALVAGNRLAVKRA